MSQGTAPARGGREKGAGDHRARRRPAPAAAGPAVHLRPRTPEDTAFLRRLYGETRAAELAQVAWPPAMKEAFLDDQFRLQDADYTRRFPDAAFQIVCAGRRPIGRLYVAETPDGVHVIDISLNTAVQGRGLGTALLQQVIAQAGPRPVRLQVAAGNRAAGLYARLGFAPSGPAGSVYQRLERPPDAD